LEGLKGIEEIKRKFSFFKEIIVVYYNSKLIQVLDMENALKEAGVYSATEI
jgi:hypothetical protein